MPVGRTTAGNRTTTSSRTAATAHTVTDQSNSTGGTGAGFGEAGGEKYKGQGFIPTATNLSAISFQLNSTGTQGMKVIVDNADSNFFPTGTLETGIYSFEITNANLSTSLKSYALPVAQSLTPGNRYCFYLAPWNTTTHVYADDYRDMNVSVANPYANGNVIQNNGSWYKPDSSNQDLVFATSASVIRTLAS